MQIAPEKNVQYAAVAAFLAPLLIHLATANGVVVPPDVATAAPGCLAVVVAWISDLADAWAAKK